MKKTMRRALYIIAALLAALFVLSCLIGFAACGGGSKDDCADGHTVTSWTTTKEATCTEAGSKTGTCDVCGETVTEPIAALGHDYQLDTTAVGYVETTTCGGGTNVYVCSRCKDTYTETVNGDGKHTWNDGEVTTAATCTTDGVMTYTCTKCGETKTETIEATGHTSDGGKVTKAATIYEAGEMTYTCTVCNEIISSETIPKLDAEDYTSNFLTGRLTGVDETYVTYTNWKDSSLSAKMAGSEIEVEFDNSKNPMTYTVSGTAAVMDDDQLKAFWGETGAEDEAHANAQYITIAFVANAGEKFTITSEKSPDGLVIDGDADDPDDTFYTLVYDVSNWSEENTGETVFTIDDGNGKCDVVIGDIELFTVVDSEEELRTAIAAGGDVALSGDMQLSSSLTIGDGTNEVEVELDLAGYDLSSNNASTGKANSTIYVKAGATLTIVDNSSDGDGDVDASADDTAALYNDGGTVIIAGGTFERSKEEGEQEKWVSGQNSYYTVVNDGGDMTIEDGAVIFNAGDYSTCLKSSGTDASDPATLTINGGLIYGGKYAVKNDYSGKLVMTGGTVGGPRSEDDTLPYRALQNWDNATITGGKLLGGNGGASDTETAADGAEAEGVVIYNNSGENSNTDNLEGTDRNYEVGTLTIGDENGNGPEIIYGGVNAYAATPTSDDDDDETPKFATGIAIDSGTVNFKAGTIECSDTAAEKGYNFMGVYMTNGTLNVSGGEISGDEAIVIDCAEDEDATVSATITGGTFVGGIWSYVTSEESGSVTVDESLNLVKVAYDASGTVIADETAEGVEVDHYIYRDQIECDTVGHVLVGTYADGSWTYVCSECGDAIELGESTLVASLTLEVADYASLSAAGTWNEIENMSLTIHVVTTDENNGAISVTGNFGLRYGEKTIILDADINMGSSCTIIVVTTVVLDLNGHTISRTNDSSLTTGVVQVGQYRGGDYNYYEYGDLTVKDTSSEGGGKISGSYGVTVFGGSVDNTDSSVSKFTLVSGTIEGSVLAISTNGSTEWGAEEITIQGGTVSGGAAGIYLPSGSLTVSGGSISGKTGIEIKASSASITGGKISTTEDGQPSVNKGTGTTDTSGFSIAVIAGSDEGAYKDMISVSISGCELTGPVYVDVITNSDGNEVVTVSDELGLTKVAYDSSDQVIDNPTSGATVDHYVYTAADAGEET